MGTRELLTGAIVLGAMLVAFATSATYREGHAGHSGRAAAFSRETSEGPSFKEVLSPEDSDERRPEPPPHFAPSCPSHRF